MKAIKAILLSGILMSGVFALFSLTLHFGDWQRLLAVSVIGLFVGLIAAPVLAPEKFKEPLLWQGSCGFAAGLTIAIYFQFETPYFALSVLVGTVLGATAPFWIKHVPIP